MSSPAALRLADPSSLDQLLPLFREYQAHYSALTSATESQTRDFLKEVISQPQIGAVVLAEVDGQIAGFATAFFTVSGVISERMVHLGDLYVAPGHRRRGIATHLVDEVARFAERNGIRLVRWLSVASNTELNSWYSSLGATGGEFRLFLLEAATRAHKEPGPTVSSVTPRAGPSRTPAPGGPRP